MQTPSVLGDAGGPNDSEKLRPEFQSWIDIKIDGSCDLQTMLADIRDNLLPLFHYNNFELADDGTTIKCDLRSGTVTFKNAMRHEDLLRNSGICGELAVKAFLLIKKKYPILAGKMAIVCGNEPAYFSDITANHIFLIIVDGHLVKYISRIDDYELWTKRGADGIGIHGTIFLVDPTFGSAQPYENSGYRIKGFLPVRRNCKDMAVVNTIMTTARVPLALMDQSAKLAGLQFFLNGNLKLSVLPKFKRVAKEYPVEPGALLSEVLRNEPEILEAVLAIRRKVLAARAIV